MNTRVMEIRPDGVVCQRDGEEIFVPADTVVCALGFRSPYDTVDQLCALVDEYYIIGDCKNVGQIYQAVNNGFYAGLQV